MPPQQPTVFATISSGVPPPPPAAAPPPAPAAQAPPAPSSGGPAQTASASPVSWEEIVGAEAARQKVDPRLAIAVARTENGGYDPSARSPAGAIGLMQLMPATAKRHGVDPTDPYQNIKGGVAELRQLLDQNGGDVRKALSLYNGSPSADPAVTGAYADRVLARIQGMPRGAGTAPAAQPATPATPAAQPAATPPPAPSPALAKFGPMPPDSGRRMSPETERMIGGAVGAGALGMATEGLGFLPEIAEGVEGLPAAIKWGAAGIRSLASTAGAAAGGAGVAASQGAPPTEVKGAAEQQAGWEFGGKLAFAPASWLLKRAAATTIYKAASEGLAGARSSIADAFGKALERAESLVGETAAAGTEARATAATRVAQTQATGRAGVEAATAASRQGVEGATARLQTAKTAGEQAMEGQRAQFAATPPPSPSPTVAGRTAAQVVAHPTVAGEAPGAVQGSFNRMGQDIERTLGQTPMQDVTAIKAQAQGILDRETTLPLAVPPPEQATQALPSTSRTALERILRMPDRTTAADLHDAMKTLGDIGWKRGDVSLTSENIGRAKKVYSTIRQQLGAANPELDQALTNYSKATKLYNNSLAPQIVKKAMGNPDAIAGLFDPYEPERLRMTQRVFLEHGGAEGQAAWDGLRSHIVYDHFIAGGLDKLGERLADPRSQEFLQVLGGDPAGARVIGRLREIAAGFETLQADSAAAVGTAQAGVASARSAGAQGISAARSAASTANLGAQQAQHATTVGTAETLGARKDAAAGLKSSAGAADKQLSAQQKYLQASSLKNTPGVGQTLKDLAILGGTGAFTAAGAAAGGHVAGPVGAMIGGSFGPMWYIRHGAIRRLMQSPEMADLVQWASYAGPRTQALVRALKSPAPGMLVADLLRQAKIGTHLPAATPPPGATGRARPPQPQPQAIATPPPR
jgi:Transglycosylase SLT domain